MLRSGLTSELRERGELEKLVDAEDTVEEGKAADTSSTTDVENEADVTTNPANGKGNGVGNGDGKCTDTDTGKLVDEETRAEGRVSLRTYWTYIKAAGIVCWILTFAFMLLIRLINVGFQVSESLGVRSRVIDHPAVLRSKMG